MLEENRTFVICELAQTHEGNISLAKELVHAASDAGADAVKFQIFTADELAVPAYKDYGSFKKLEWSKSQWKELIDISHNLGLKAIADVFGTTSARMLGAIGIDAIKIHTTDIRNRPLLDELARMSVPLFLSAGGTYLDELKEALEILQSKDRENRLIVLLYGFQSYPTLIEHTNLLKMQYFGKALNLPYGFADHIDGDHQQNFSLCAMAVGMGACVIEKHITIDRSLKMDDYESALDPSGFKDFVKKVRELDAAKGKAEDKLLPFEMKYRRATRKHVVALRELKKGMVITSADVALKRAVLEEEPENLEEVLGRVLERDLKEHEAILNKDLI